MYKQFRATIVKNVIDASIVIFVLNALNVKTVSIVITVLIYAVQTIASTTKVVQKKRI